MGRSVLNCLLTSLLLAGIAVGSGWTAGSLQRTKAEMAADPQGPMPPPIPPSSAV